jgi:hypothetical protein
MVSKSQSSLRDSFRFRFSNRKLRDKQLMQWIAEDLEEGQVNISEVIKDLLYAWYCQRHSGGSGLLPPMLAIASGSSPKSDSKQPENLEDPNDPLVQAFSNISFDEFPR